MIAEPNQIATSSKTRIKTCLTFPLKQIWATYQIATSSKTRIKTINLFVPIKLRGFIRLQHPVKQGLRPFRTTPWTYLEACIRLQHPVKQGLRRYLATWHGSMHPYQIATSSKTRIKTLYLWPKQRCKTDQIATSSKTRIKTSSNDPNMIFLVIRLQHPVKQGLRLYVLMPKMVMT